MVGIYYEEVITGSGNNMIKHIRELHQRKYRKQHKEYLAEGYKTVKEALHSGAMVKLIAVSQDCRDAFGELLEAAETAGVRTIFTTQRLFEQISDTKTPEGILAVVSIETFDLAAILNKPSCFLLVLDGIRDPGNMGTIIRTVDAAGGDGICLVNDCVDPYNPKAVRSTMGSIFRVPLFSPELSVLLSSLEEYGFHVVISHLDGENLFQWHCSDSKIALVVGSESHGVSGKLAESADSMVKIPILGGAESLNASVAAGILIYDMVRRGSSGIKMGHHMP